MAISEYKGPANSRELFRHLVGEKITAAYQNDEGQIVVVVESGHGVTFSGGSDKTPAYWVEKPDAIQRFVSKRRADIARLQAELRDLAGVNLDEGEA